jgi:carnitine O-acetyltransferase
MLANQNKLPKLPVPTLASSRRAHLASAQPLLSPQELAAAEALWDDFAATVGPRLQAALEQRAAAAATSWVRPHPPDSLF